MSIPLIQMKRAEVKALPQGHTTRTRQSYLQNLDLSDLRSYVLTIVFTPIIRKSKPGEEVNYPNSQRDCFGGPTVVFVKR